MKFVRADFLQTFLCCNVLSYAFDWLKFQSNVDAHANEAHTILRSEKNDWKSCGKNEIEEIHMRERTTLATHYIQFDI